MYFGDVDTFKYLKIINTIILSETYRASNRVYLE